MRKWPLILLATVLLGAVVVWLWPAKYLLHFIALMLGFGLMLWAEKV
jgi:hypothetical protein